LHVTIDRAEGEKPDAKQDTRIERIRRAWKPDPEWLEGVSQQTYETLRDQYLPDLPPLACGEYLVGYLMDVGPTGSGAMGPTPLTYHEIAAWQTVTGTPLQPFEAQWLRRLSSEWIGEQQKSSGDFAPPPWTPELE
jgi:hypothetical protein